MEHTASPHDNHTDVRINTKINVYGNVIFIGSISVVSVGFMFFGIWLTNFWSTAVMLSAIMVYTFVGLAGLALLGLIAALWIKLVVQPGATAYQLVVESRGQDWRNRLIHAQDNGVVLALPSGELEVVPLFAPLLAETSEKEQPVEVERIIELIKQGCTIKTIMDTTHAKYNRVQKIRADYIAGKLGD